MHIKMLIVITISVITTSLKAQQPSHTVKIVGQMKNVMQQGKLDGNIKLDTIANQKNLYGLGPVAYLKGEILVVNGKSYKSTVVSDTTMKVEETYALTAPFFGYANIAKWTEQILPDSVETIQQLEKFLITLAQAKQPFLFKLSGTAQQAKIHVVNLPEGLKVNSPADAHHGQVNYKLNDLQVEIVGFFSTAHQSIFTHHDTYLHMHLITTDQKKMGHLDEMILKKGTVKLYLPEL